MLEREALKKMSEAESNVRSFTAAGTLPWKLIKNTGCVVNGEIKPVHLQLSPTNACNSKCPWCSCSEVDRRQELCLTEIQDIFGYFMKLGTRAVTITGGGEPTVHPDIMGILSTARAWCGFDVGMVTNGLLWGQEDSDIERANNYLTWLRVSIVNPSGAPQPLRVARICNKLPKVDVGVSFTVPYDVNVEAAWSLCKLADSLANLTHIRFVQDILKPDDVAMDKVVTTCDGITKKAIFQYRNAFTKGSNPCWISKLKPYVDATGYIYPCCGSQYSHPDSLRKMGEMFRMCYWSEFDRVAAFDGSICQKCYYEQYNTLLNNMVTPLQHENFV